MKFVLKPSLEHMTLVQIGISLWNQNDVWALILKLKCMDLYESEWEKIEDRVTQKVSQLSLPELLKEKVFGVIKPIGMQIFEWLQYYRKYNGMIHSHCMDRDFPVHLPGELCWTPGGTVDRKRTAEVLVRDENLTVTRRYILACDSFLEDDIIRFWNILPKYRKDYDWNNYPVIRFWSNKMKTGRVDRISYKRVFDLSVADSNKVAAKYFLQKLTLQEREESLKDLAVYVNDTAVLCFLLPELEEDEQREVFKNVPYRVFQWFLQWPWQSFFIGVANSMWDFLTIDSYGIILDAIVRKVRDGYRDCNYQKLFEEFWQKSPSALKDSFLDETNMSWLLPFLHDIKDKENIRLILQHATPTVKEKLVYDAHIMKRCLYFIQYDEWDFLELCIRECLSSKEAMLKFKEKFEKRMSPYFKEHFETKKPKWDQLFHMSDISICKYDKRCLEEVESS